MSFRSAEVGPGDVASEDDLRLLRRDYDALMDAVALWRLPKHLRKHIYYGTIDRSFASYAGLWRALQDPVDDWDDLDDPDRHIMAAALCAHAAGGLYRVAKLNDAAARLIGDVVRQGLAEALRAQTVLRKHQGRKMGDGVKDRWKEAQPDGIGFAEDAVSRVRREERNLNAGRSAADARIPWGRSLAIVAAELAIERDAKGLTPLCATGPALREYLRRRHMWPLDQSNN